MSFVIVCGTPKLIEGGHRGLQTYRPLAYNVNTSTFFTFSHKCDFLRSFTMFRTFSLTMTTVTALRTPPAATDVYINEPASADCAALSGFLCCGTHYRLLSFVVCLSVLVNLGPNLKSPIPTDISRTRSVECSRPSGPRQRRGRGAGAPL